MISPKMKMKWLKIIKKHPIATSLVLLKIHMCFDVGAVDLFRFHFHKCYHRSRLFRLHFLSWLSARPVSSWGTRLSCCLWNEFPSLRERKQNGGTLGESSNSGASMVHCNGEGDEGEVGLCKWRRGWAEVECWWRRMLAHGVARSAPPWWCPSSTCQWQWRSDGERIVHDGPKKKFPQ